MEENWAKGLGASLLMAGNTQQLTVSALQFNPVVVVSVNNSNNI